MISLPLGASFVSARSLKVALHNFPPCAALGERPRGRPTEIIEKIAIAEGYEFDFIQMNTPAEAPAPLASGDADLHPFLAPDDRRRAVAQFTRPFQWIRFQLFALEDRVAEVERPAAGTVSSIGAMRGAAPASVPSKIDGARHHLSSATTAFRPRCRAGRSPPPLMERRRFVRSLPLEDRFAALGEDSPSVPPAFAVSRHGPNLMAEIDGVLTRLMARPSFEAISERWASAGVARRRPVGIACEFLSHGGAPPALIIPLISVVMLRVDEIHRLARLADPRRHAQKLGLANLDLERENEGMQRLRLHGGP